MRTAEIFNGNTLIKVNEGSKFNINGVWSWDIGTHVTFGVRQDVSVVAKVISKDGAGSQLEVISINTLDDLADMVVESKEVEVETVENVETEIPKLSIKKNKFTKKEVVAYVEEHNIDVDTSLSKNNLINTLEALNLVEYK